jgi:hypothetical protein
MRTDIVESKTVYVGDADPFADTWDPKTAKTCTIYIIGHCQCPCGCTRTIWSDDKGFGVRLDHDEDGHVDSGEPDTCPTCMAGKCLAPILPCHVCHTPTRGRMQDVPMCPPCGWSIVGE